MKDQKKNTYFMAAKREHRNSLPDDWHLKLSEMEGVHIVNISGFRGKIIATPSGFRQVAAEYGDLFLIEEGIERDIL